MEKREGVRRYAPLVTRRLTSFSSLRSLFPRRRRIPGVAVSLPRRNNTGIVFPAEKPRPSIITRYKRPYAPPDKSLFLTSAVRRAGDTRRFYYHPSASSPTHRRTSIINLSIISHSTARHGRRIHRGVFARERQQCGCRVTRFNEVRENYGDRVSP